jgi:predicted GNAT superfamily acetyltransferase
MEVRIRPIATLAEFRACVELQADVWGPEYTDNVPASLLQIATYVGGVVLGAFTSGDELVGFLFGLTGVDGDEIVHWSHLLGVRDAARNLGVGRLLKEAQRAQLARLGVQRMSWSFDPLVAKNAYLNLNRLGARVSAYVPNMYGTTTSPLHYGIATDRLVVSLDTRATGPARGAVGAAVVALPVLTPEPQDGDLPVDASAPPPALWVEIPSEIRQVIEDTPAAVVGWRDAVREHFQWALALGYEVRGLQRDPVTSRSFYVLHMKETP